MDHVNNAVYADWLEEAVIAAGGRAAVRAIPRLARLEYARAAEPGATVEATTLAGRRWPGRAASPMPTARTCCVPGSRRDRSGSAPSDVVRIGRGALESQTLSWRR